MATQTKTVSVVGIQDNLVGQGMSVPEAAKKAKEQFPKNVADLLDQGWEVMTGDSTTVHLIRKDY